MVARLRVLGFMVGVACWWSGGASCSIGGEEAARAPAEPGVDYAIVVTGHELLTGVYADAHTLFLTRTLGPLGYRCVNSISVDDEPAEIQEILRFARERAQLVIVTGGLGPTDSDVTRETLSDFTGIALRENEALLATMERRFQTPRDKLRENLRKQTRVPDRGGHLEPVAGTAAGLIFDGDPLVIVALPGPPHELQPMVREELIPYLTRRFGTRSIGCRLTARFVGLGESQINHTLKEHVQLPPNVMQTSQFDGGRVDFTFALPDDGPDSRARLERLRADLSSQFGDSIYAFDADTTLEHRVVELLSERQQTIAVAEVGSGGNLAGALCRGEGNATVWRGAYVAPTSDTLRDLLDIPRETWNTRTVDQQQQLVSEAVAHVRRADWAVTIGEPQGDAQLLPVTIRHPDGRWTAEQLRWPGWSPAGQSRLVTQLLDLLRKVIP